MSGSKGLCETNTEDLFRILEASINVRKRYQFFLWAQGELQRLLPHEVLICATGNMAQGKFKLDCYSAQDLPVGLADQLGNAANGLMGSIVTAWQEGGFMPLLLSTCRACEGEGAWMAREVQRLGLVDCALHGIADYHSGTGAIFAFFRIIGGVQDRHALCLEMLVPHMHMALQRTVFSERMPAELNYGDAVLSDREAEILKWIRAGKTNQEIGLILDISPFTVKNHVQKILRKLNVTNRTQAVALLSRRMSSPASDVA